MECMQQISPAMKQVLLSALIPYGVVRVAIAGSFARGQARPDSHPDVVVAFREPKGSPNVCISSGNLHQQSGGMSISSRKSPSAPILSIHSNGILW